jgi:uncharacterized protein (TIGR02145 family)
MKTKLISTVNTPLLGRACPETSGGWGRLFLLLAFIGLSQMNAQVGIGTTSPDASSILDVTSPNDDKGFLPPRLTTAQRDAIASPAVGLTIFNTTNGCIEFYNGELWVSACDGSLQPGPLTDCGGSFIAPFITADETEIVEVTITTANGPQTWMDRNLGAITAARASDDCYAYGNLHQWGRGNDGHEDRNSSPDTGPKTAGNEGSDFLTNSNDWLSGQDDTRWGDPTPTDKNTLYDPCPAGYRVPSEAELIDLDATFATQDAAGAFGSLLKLPVAGRRSFSTSSASLADVGSEGHYWSSTVVNVSQANYLLFGSGFSITNNSNRAAGRSVRCIKD